MNEGTPGGVRVALDHRCQLGEGLHWDARRQRLWMVDIQARRLFRWDLQSAKAESWTLSQRIGWVIPYDSGAALLLGLQGGFARAEIADGLHWTWVTPMFDGHRELRLNDAKADANGAVWAGSMNNDDESRPDGGLFRLGPDGRVTQHDQGLCVANGPAISPCGRWMLHTDSAARTIYRHDLDSANGLLGPRTVWRRFTPDEGFPDGMTFDAEGALWVAHWGAGCVSRFDAEGRLLRRIDLPARQVTNVCFGGAALDRLFVSSASVGLAPDAHAAQPLAGALFEVNDPGVQGLPGRAYGGVGTAR